MKTFMAKPAEVERKWYVVDADGVVRLRQVRPGHRYGDRVEILAGLTEGERVVKDPIAALTWLAAQRKGEGNG